MKKKKIIIGSILAATTVLGVASCKKDKNPTTTVDSTTTPVVESSTKTPTPTPNYSTSPVESSKNEVLKYGVTYNIKDHGTQPDNLTDVTNLPSELPTLTDDDYNFEGWYIDEEYTTKAEAGSLLTADITLYAKWSLKEGQNDNPDEGNNDQGGDQTPDNGDQGEDQTPDNGDQGGDQTPDNGDQGEDQTPDNGDQGESGDAGEDNTVKFGIIYNNNGLGVKPEDVSEVSAITAEHLTGLTEKYCTFINWYLDAELTIAATADCDVTNYIQDGNVTLYAKWEKSAYYEFIHQDGLVYENHFDNADETIIDSSVGTAQKGEWSGTASKGSFTDANKVTISNGGLLLTDTDSSLNTSATLKFDPIYASKVEIIASIKMSKVSGKWNLLNILDDSGNSIFAIRTDDTYKNIGYTITGDKAVDTGVSYTVNSSVDLKITLDLINGKASIVINDTKTIEDIALDTSKILNVGQIKLVTATDARNIEMDYLAIRSYDEDSTTLKTNLKTKLGTKYNSYKQEEYTTNYESLTNIYNTAISAIDSATSAIEAVSTYNTAIADLAAVKSDATIVLDAAKEQALANIETQYNNIISKYTIIVDSNNEDDTYENKTSLDEAFTNVKASINNAKSADEIDTILDEFSIEDILDDDDLLEIIADDLYETFEEYLEEKGPFNYNEEQILEIADELAEKFEEIVSNAELSSNEKKANLFEKLTSAKSSLDLVLNDTAQLAKNKEDAISEISSYKSTEIEGIKESHETEYNQIISIKNGAADSINACTSFDEVTHKLAEIKESIDTLYNAASKTIEELREDAKNNLKTYKDNIIANYNQENDATLITAIEGIYNNTDYSNAKNATEINEITSNAKSQIQQLITADTLAKRKVSAKEEIKNLRDSIKDELYSNELKKQVDTNAAELLSNIDSYDNIDDLNAYVSDGKESLQNILDDADSYEFTITYYIGSESYGTIDITYGSYIDLEDIHITAMNVVGASFENNDSTSEVEIYDDYNIYLQVEDKEDMNKSILANFNGIENSNNLPEKVFDNCLFDMVADSGWQYTVDADNGKAKDDDKYALFNKNSLPTKSDGTKYDCAWRSINVSSSEEECCVVTFNIKDNLQSLKLWFGYADSIYANKRKGTIIIKVNNENKITITENETGIYNYEKELTGLQSGDVVKIIMKDLNSGSRLFIFDIEATLANDTPKLVNVAYNGDTTKYSYLDEIVLPDSSDIERFNYWYYLDENNEEVVVNEGTKLASGTNIELQAKLHDYNVKITYMNGEEKYQDETEYAVWEGNTSISKPEVDPTDGDNEFLGWYLKDSEGNYYSTSFDFENVEAGEYTLYANFAAAKEVSFDWNLPVEGLTISDYTINGTKTEGSEINTLTTAKITLDSIPSSATLEGYRLLGWSFESGDVYNLITGDVDLTQSETIYARWIKTYTVTFNSNGGSSVASQTIDENGKVTEPTNPEKTGNIFGGWYKDESFTNTFDFANDTITGDITIFAKWEQATTASDQLLSSSYESFSTSKVLTGDDALKSENAYFSVESGKKVKYKDGYLQCQTSGDYMSVVATKDMTIEVSLASGNSSKLYISGGGQIQTDDNYIEYDSTGYDLTTSAKTFIIQLNSGETVKFTNDGQKLRLYSITATVTL